LGIGHWAFRITEFVTLLAPLIAGSLLKGQWVKTKIDL